MDKNKLIQMFRGKQKTENLIVLSILIIVVVVAINYIWNDKSNKRYLTYLLVHTNDSDNHMLDLVQTISMMNVSVDGIKIMSKGEKSIYEISCYITGLEQLEKMLLTLNKQKYIEKVEREIR